MIIRKQTSLPFINPGYGFVPDEPTRLCAVIGSGVVVTLFDREKRVGGIGYFFRPYREPGKPSTAVYAAPAIISIIRILSDQGSKVANMEAQIFGGAFNLEHKNYEARLHDLNAQTSIELLEKQNIVITGKDIGGTRGRKIGFNTNTGETAIAKINRIRNSDWYPQIPEQLFN